MNEDDAIFDLKSSQRIARVTRRVEQQAQFAESPDYGPGPIDAGGSITVMITGAAAGGGEYTGRSVVGESTATAGTDLVMPAGMTVAAADDCVVLFLPESGLLTHILPVDGSCFLTGLIVGVASDGKLLVEAGSPRGSKASPATLGAGSEGSEAAASDTWHRDQVTSGTDYGGKALDLWVTCRVGYFEAGDEKLYAYVRKLSIDAGGLVYAVGAETRVEVDAPEACT